MKLQKQGEDKVEITKVTKGWKINLSLSIRSTLWLATRLEQLAKKDENWGAPEITKEKDLEIWLRVKRNKGGTFISILEISNRFRAGRTYICCPKGDEGRGWTDLAVAKSEQGSP